VKHNTHNQSPKHILTPPLVIEVSVPSQETERPCICVFGVSVLPLSVIFLLDFRNVLTVWYSMPKIKSWWII